MANVLEYLPEPIKVIREFQAIATAEDPELSALWQSIADAELDQFIDEATTTGVKRWEANLGLAPKPTDTLEERRLRIKTRINEQPPYTYRTLDQKLTTLCGERITLFERFLEDVPAASWSVEAITDFVNAHGSPITYSNLKRNADFKAGTTGWGAFSGSSLSAANGKLAATGIGTNTLVGAQCADYTTAAIGHKYYINAKATAVESGAASMTFRFVIGTTNYDYTIPNPVAGAEYNDARTITASTVAGLVDYRVFLTFADAASTSGKTLEVFSPETVRIDDSTQIATLEARLGRVLTDQELGILLPFVTTSHTPKDVGGYTLDVDVEGFTVTVRLALTEKAAYEEVDGLLERIVPLNMIIDLSLLYNQHDLLASYTHSRLGLYTHDQLRNEDISTLTYGMMEGQTISNLEGVN